MNHGLSRSVVAAAIVLSCSNSDQGVGGELAADGGVRTDTAPNGSGSANGGSVGVGSAGDASPPSAVDASDSGEASDAGLGNQDASGELSDAALAADGDAGDDGGLNGGGDDSGAPPEPIGFHFIDVAQAAGLAQPQWTLPDSWTGLPCQNSLLHSAGGAVVDIDDDGWLDLFVTRFEQPNLLYRNRGDGTFEDIAPQAGLDVVAWSNGASFADIDGDSDLDLFVTSVGPGPAMLFVNQGDGTFVEDAAARGVDVGRPSGCSEVTSASFGDYDHDYDLDLYVSHWTRKDDDLNFLFKNDGTGHFTNVTQTAGVAIPEPFGFSSGFMDADGDGWEELFVTADFGNSRLFHNDKDGTFTDVTTQAGVGTDQNGMGSALGDVNGDGFPDWFIAAIRGPGIGNRIYINDGDGTFTDRTNAYGVAEGGWGWGALLFDVNNDGQLDASHVAGFDLYRPLQPARLWLGGALPWREVSVQAGFADMREGRAILPIDFDRDGDEDVFIANVGDVPALYRNDLEFAHHWLVVRAVGTISNAQSIGAHIEVENANGTTQHRWITANSTLYGHGPFEAHFGLGEDSGPVEVRVTWPVSGKTTSTVVAPDQYLTLEEPCSVCPPLPDAGSDAGADAG